MVFYVNNCKTPAEPFAIFTKYGNLKMYENPFKQRPSKDGSDQDNKRIHQPP
jgi:hypothetical protein